MAARRSAPLMAALLCLVVSSCHFSSHPEACAPASGAVRAWRPADGAPARSSWAKVSGFNGMSGSSFDVVTVDHHGVIEAPGLRGGTFRAVLEPAASAALARCIDAPAYAQVAAHYSSDSGSSSGAKLCAVTDASDITILTDATTGPKRVSAYALDLVVGAYGPESGLRCDLGYPAALRVLASGLYALRAQVEAHGTRVG